MENELRDHFLSLLTERRRGRFEDVLAGRTRRAAVVLENVSQSHNFSAVLRSCDCFGVQDVYVADRDETFSVNREIALGADKWLTVRRFLGADAMPDCVAALKSRGYRVLVTSPHGESEPVGAVDVSTPVALVFGTELEGVTDAAEDLADGRVHIPMYGFTESLNVSVAVAVTLANVTGRLRESPGWELSDREKDALRLEWAKRTVTNADVIEAEFRAAKRIISNRSKGCSPRVRRPPPRR